MEYHLWPNHKHDEVANVVRQLGFRILRQTLAVTDGMLLAHRN